MCEGMWCAECQGSILWKHAAFRNLGLLSHSTVPRDAAGYVNDVPWVSYTWLYNQSYTIRVAVNLEGDYGKSSERASGASY